jgi:hypothetical protein
MTKLDFEVNHRFCRASASYHPTQLHLSVTGNSIKSDIDSGSKSSLCSLSPYNTSNIRNARITSSY